jgi:hypothetical protein
MRITLCARSKILQLLEPGNSFRIHATGSLKAGQHVDLLPNTEEGPNDCIICHMPRVVADISTMTLLADKTIDYSYQDGEFIISNRGNE